MNLVYIIFFLNFQWPCRYMHISKNRFVLFQFVIFNAVDKNVISVGTCIKATQNRIKIHVIYVHVCISPLKKVSFLVYRCIINSILFQWKIDDFPPYSLIFSVGLSNVSTWWELEFWKKKKHKLDLLFLKCVIVYSRFIVTQNHVFPQEAVCWLKNHTSRKKNVKSCDFYSGKQLSSN